MNCGGNGCISIQSNQGNPDNSTMIYLTYLFLEIRDLIIVQLYHNTIYNPGRVGMAFRHWV